MIVLHKQQLIYVRTRKTASTSVEIALSRHAQPGDIVTSLSPRDEALRLEEGGHPPQGHLRPGEVPGPEPVAPGPGERVRYYNHMSAQDIRRVLGSHTWDTYRTFTTERSPYEKVISLYFHRYRERPRIALDEFVNSGEFADAVNWPLYTDPSLHVMVDTVIPHSQLESGLAELCEEVGLPQMLLPRAKGQFRPPGTDYHRMLSHSSRRAIEAAYGPEFQFHGYRWEGTGADHP